MSSFRRKGQNKPLVSANKQSELMTSSTSSSTTNEAGNTSGGESSTGNVSESGESSSSVTPSGDSVPSVPSLRSVVGVKAWISGCLGLVSSGNKQLDEIIGGGFALETITVVEIDSFSNYGDTVLLYNIAESVSVGHSTFVAGLYNEDLAVIENTLPFNQTIGRDKLSTVSSGGSSSENNTASEDGEGGIQKDKDSTKSELVIAWQYGKYMKNGKEGASSSKQLSKDDDPPISSLQGCGGNTTANTTTQYCSSYDLSRRMQRSLTDRNPAPIHYVCVYDAVSATRQLPPQQQQEQCQDQQLASPHLPTGALSQALDMLYDKMSKFVTRRLAAEPNTVVRIVISQLCAIISTYVMEDAEDSKYGSGGARNGPSSKALVGKFLLRVKEFIRKKRVSVVFSVNRRIISNYVAVMINHVADSVINVESFAGRTQSIPYEFKEYCGFLHIKKVQQLGVIAPFRPMDSRYGLKRDRRKLHVERLHLPPEESRAMSSSNRVSGSGGSATNSSNISNSHSSSNTIASSGGSAYEGSGNINIKNNNSNSSSSSSSIADSGDIQIHNRNHHHHHKLNISSSDSTLRLSADNTQATLKTEEDEDEGDDQDDYYRKKYLVSDSFSGSISSSRGSSGKGASVQMPPRHSANNPSPVPARTGSLAASLAAARQARQQAQQQQQQQQQHQQHIIEAGRGSVTETADGLMPPVPPSPSLTPSVNMYSSSSLLMTSASGDFVLPKPVSISQAKASNLTRGGYDISSSSSSSSNHKTHTDSGAKPKPTKEQLEF